MPARHAPRWRREAAAIRAYVEAECWSDELRSYTRIAGSRDVDASLLMLPLVGYDDPRGERIRGTIDAVNRTLRTATSSTAIAPTMACRAGKGAS